MKKIGIFVLSSVLGIALLTGCSFGKKQEVNEREDNVLNEVINMDLMNSSKITIVKEDTAQEIEVIDNSEIDEILCNLSGIDFKTGKEETNLESGYILRFYSAEEKEIGELVVSSKSLIQYEDNFYVDKTGSIAYDYFNSFFDETKSSGDIKMYKPVIYLYPTKEMDIKVDLDYNGQLICTYPAYEEGWNITAFPDGTLINSKDHQEYSYLFWEGISDFDYDLSKGFVVKGEDTAAFLQEKLSFLGLTPKEYNEFIVFWLPLMQENTYNLISFQGENYTSNAKLTVSPEPDSILRIFMVYQPLEEYQEMEEQKLVPFERKGFSVIEWGGSAIEP